MMSKEIKMDFALLQNEAKKIAQSSENLQNIKNNVYRANCTAMEQWQGRSADAFVDTAYASEEMISAQSMMTQTLSGIMNNVATVREALDVSVGKRAQGKGFQDN